ncbi:MAG TPA: energy transducer TonB [Terriglobales bacterium]|jgi:protein TonB|nr:energy transducer TonB [Terriglobales bacterium]
MSNFALIEELDSGIDVLFTDSDVAISHVDAAVAELLGIAAELRTLPRPDFRSQLRVSLMESALASSTISGPEVMASAVIGNGSFSQKRVYPGKEQVLPTLFGAGVGTYAARRSNFAISVAAHAVALALILTSGLWIDRHRDQRVQAVTLVVPPVSDYLALDNASKSAAGGGGGGDHDRLEASRGHLPKQSLEQFAPPEVVIRNEDPRLAAEASVIVPPQVNLPTNRLPNLGDPRSTVAGPLSNGPGSGAGIGSGGDQGIGSGFGGGVGDGMGGSYGGGIFSVGGGVSAPRAIYKLDPEYSPEARQAKYQGTVVLSLVVTPDGKAHGLRVVRSLGMGLDEKAIEAVKQWRFEPARKDGKPVAVAVDVEVNFRLF